MLNGLDLFSGIGGISLALSPWVRTVAYCEIDRFAQGVLLSRISDGQLEAAPIYDDIRNLTASHLPGIDIISGGFPCQDISCAGNGAGLDGKRSGLFFEVARLVSEIRPTLVFLENVPAIRSRGADVVVGRLAELGYDARWGVLSAFDVGAPHLRERWWLLAYNTNHVQQNSIERISQRSPTESGGTGNVSDADSFQLRNESDGFIGRQSQTISGDNGPAQSLANADSEPPRWSPESWGKRDWWSSEPGMGRVVTGLPHRLDRLKGLGNSVVPACAREAFERLMGL